jgi:hypothetical protein
MAQKPLNTKPVNGLHLSLGQGRSQQCDIRLFNRQPVV